MSIRDEALTRAREALELDATTPGGALTIVDEGLDERYSYWLDVEGAEGEPVATFAASRMHGKEGVALAKARAERFIRVRTLLPAIAHDVEALVAREARLVALLRESQWAARRGPDGDRACESCDGYQIDGLPRGGHAADCELWAALEGR